MIDATALENLMREICPDLQDGTPVYVALQSAGVPFTDDQGQTWTHRYFIPPGA